MRIAWAALGLALSFTVARAASPNYISIPQLAAQVAPQIRGSNFAGVPLDQATVGGSAIGPQLASALANAAAAQAAASGLATKGTFTWPVLNGPILTGGAIDSTTTVAGNLGTTRRTITAHFSDRINVKDYGAVGDGIADDTASAQAAYAAAATACATGPVALDFPPGRYSMSSAWKPAISCAYPIAIIGAGPGETSIVFSGTDGFDITGLQSTGNLDVRIEGMRVLISNTSSTLAGTAISIVSPTTPGLQIRPLITNVLMGDAAVDQASGWAIGINLNTTVDAVLTNDKVVMPNYATGTTGTGIQIEGSNASDFSISTHVLYSTVDGGYAGVLVGSYVQTVDVSHGAYIGNDFGFRWDGSKTGDVPENAQVTSVNFNDLSDDVWLKGVGQNQITGNEMLQLGDQAGWAGLYAYNAGYVTAAGNTVTGLPNSVAGNSGIVIANTSGSSAALTGNIITGLHGVCMVMSGTTTMVSAAGNVCNGPYITSAYSEATQGADALGSVSFNSHTAPFYTDGINFGVYAALLFPTIGSSVVPDISADGSGGLQQSRTDGQPTEYSDNGPIQTKATTTAVVLGAYPCTQARAGLRWFVSDASSATFGAALVGAGNGPAYAEPITCNGTSWLVE